MAELEKVIGDLDQQISWIRDNDFHKFPGWGHAVLAMRDALELLKAQREVINELYTRYDGLCKEIREKYEGDDVCGLCQYDGAYVGESGDWMNECPGFETSECFCMKNSIRKMCGQPLIEEE